MTLAELVRAIEAADGTLTTSALAERFDTDPAVVAGMLDWLVRAGRMQAVNCDSIVCKARGACEGCPIASPDLGRRYLPLRPIRREARVEAHTRG